MSGSNRYRPCDVPVAQALTNRLCLLASEVWNTIGNPAEANDCFCGEGGYWPIKHPSDFRNEGSAVAYIEQVVRAALGQHRVTP